MLDSQLGLLNGHSCLYFVTLYVAVFSFLTGNGY